MVRIKVYFKLLFILLLVAGTGCKQSQVKLDVLDASKVTKPASATSPYAMSLFSPSSSPGSNTSPILRITGLNSGDAIQIFTVSGCISSVASGTSSGSTFDITISGLSQGAYTFYLSVNSVCSSAYVNYTVDITAPTMPTGITLLTPSSSPGTNPNPSLRVSGVVTGDTVGLYSDSICSVLISSAVATGSSIDFTSGTLTDGTYTFYSRATDAAGNIGPCTSSGLTYVLDTTAPSMPLVFMLSSPAGSPSSVSAPSILVMTAPGDIYKLYTDQNCSTQVASATSAGSSVVLTSSTLTQDGRYNFYVKAEDLAGNSSACSLGSVEYYYVSSVATVQIATSSIYQRLIEGSGAQSIGIVMSSAKTYPVTIYYNTNNGTADNNHVTGVSSGSVVLSAGQTSASINFSLPDNAFSDGEKFFQLELHSTNSYGVQIGANALAKVYIKDNESSYSTVAQISSGYEHSCGILTSGVLKCWGANTYGQLGDGTTIDKSSPTTIDSGTSYSIVSAAGFRTCGVTTSGVLKCWGWNAFSQVGDGTATNRLSPTIIDSGVSYLTVSVGPVHACAITSASGLKCWGNNANGQLGDFTTTTRSTPVVVDNAYTYSQISIGLNHSCGIKLGSLYCWGYNHKGQLGTGNTTSLLGPSTSIGSGFSKISAGYNRTCAIQSGTLKCWGQNSYGELGNGTYSDSLSLVTIDGGNTYSEISAKGDYSTCAITTTGVAKCWGDNFNSQLGLADPFSVTTWMPISISDTDAYSLIETALSHTCGVTAAGALKCWGSNTKGQIGNSKVAQHKLPVVVRATNDILDLAYSLYYPAYSHTCGINTLGELYCFGRNGFGELGDGTTTFRTQPLEIDVGVSYSKISVARDDNQAEHTCGITTSGVLKCWGWNSFGQLGLGHVTSKSVPFVVDGGTTYSHISTGGLHSCGITSAGILKCWGYSSYGQVGDTTFSQRNSPVVIDSGTTYTGLSVSANHSCGITSGGVLKCWGSNQYGQIGDGTAVNRSSPVVVDSGVNYLSVSTGRNHTCAIRSGAILKCWGYNFYGQIGIGSTVQQNLPVVVDSGVSYSSVYASTIHTCGITSAGSVKCWGANGFGNLGDGTTTNHSSPAVVDSGVSYLKLFLGYDMTCGITAANAFKCWGSAQNGRFLDDSQYYIPSQIIGIEGP